MPLSRQRTLLVLFVALSAGIALGTLLPEPPRFNEPPSAAATGAEPVNFSLVNQHGVTTTASDLRGSTLLVFFGYTHCPDICPTTLLEMRDVKRALGPLGSTFKGVFVSVDPERDTPERLKAYVSHFDPELIGLTGTREQTKRAAESFGAVFARGDDVDGGGYLMGHTAFGYLIDVNGAIDTVFPNEATTDEITKSTANLIQRHRT